MLDSNQLTVFQLSFIIFPVLPSNKTISPSVELAGQTTSHAHSPSAPSDTVKLVVSQSVSVIVIVCTFQEVVSVIVDIQFHAGQVGHIGHVAPVSHFGHWIPCSH